MILEFDFVSPGIALVAAITFTLISLVGVVLRFSGLRSALVDRRYAYDYLPHSESAIVLVHVAMRREIIGLAVKLLCVSVGLTAAVIRQPETDELIILRVYFFAALTIAVLLLDIESYLSLTDRRELLRMQDSGLDPKDWNDRKQTKADEV